MIIEVAAVDAEAFALAIPLAADLVPILGGDRGFEGDLVPTVLDLVEAHEHPVDQTDVVAVAKADQLLARAGRIGSAEPRRLLHGEVELYAGGVAPADNLTGPEQTGRIDIKSTHLPHESVVLAVG